MDSNLTFTHRLGNGDTLNSRTNPRSTWNLSANWGMRMEVAGAVLYGKSGNGMAPRSDSTQEAGRRKLAVRLLVADDLVGCEGRTSVLAVQNLTQHQWFDVNEPMALSMAYGLGVCTRVFALTSSFPTLIRILTREATAALAESLPHDLADSMLALYSFLVANCDAKEANRRGAYCFDVAPHVDSSRLPTPFGVREMLSTVRRYQHAVIGANNIFERMESLPRGSEALRLMCETFQRAKPYFRSFFLYFSSSAVCKLPDDFLDDVVIPPVRLKRVQDACSYGTISSFPFALSVVVQEVASKFDVFIDAIGGAFESSLFAKMGDMSAAEALGYLEHPTEGESELGIGSLQNNIRAFATQVKERMRIMLALFGQDAFLGFVVDEVPAA